MSTGLDALQLRFSFRRHKAFPCSFVLSLIASIAIQAATDTGLKLAMNNAVISQPRFCPPPLPLARMRPAMRKQGERVCRGLLWLAICTYAVVFAGLTFRLYDRFATMSYDLAIFDQAAWLISRGHSPFVTVRGLPLLADHFSLVLYLLAPLYWVWPSAKALLLAQALGLALGAVPLYALARKRLGSAPWALLLAVAYLLYPSLQWSGTFEFHPDTFATPLLLAAFWFLEGRRWGPYLACLALALMTKETVGLTVLAVGVYALRTDRRLGWATLALGAGGLAVALLTVRAFNHGAPSAFFALYGPDGVGPGNLLRTALTHPLAFGSRLMTVGNAVYVFQLLYPLAFLPFLAPEVLALALPALLLNLLSARPVMHTIQHQYTALLTPLLLLAALSGGGAGAALGQPVDAAAAGGSDRRGAGERRGPGAALRGATLAGGGLAGWGDCGNERAAGKDPGGGFGQRFGRPAAAPGPPAAGVRFPEPVPVGGLRPRRAGAAADGVPGLLAPELGGLAGVAGGESSRVRRAGAVGQHVPGGTGQVPGFCGGPAAQPGVWDRLAGAEGDDLAAGGGPHPGVAPVLSADRHRRPGGRRRRAPCTHPSGEKLAGRNAGRSGGLLRVQPAVPRTLILSSLNFDGRPGETRCFPFI